MAGAAPVAGGTLSGGAIGRVGYQKARNWNLLQRTIAREVPAATLPNLGSWQLVDDTDPPGLPADWRGVPGPHIGIAKVELQLFSAAGVEGLNDGASKAGLPAPTALAIKRSDGLRGTAQRTAERSP